MHRRGRGGSGAGRVLLLARESPLAEPIRARIAHWDGVETSVFGSIRGYAPPASPLLTLVRELEAGGADTAIEALVAWSEGSLWPAGQDSAFAAELARKEVTVGGIVRAVERAIDEGITSAKRIRPLSAGAGLSAVLGTTYPIVQGPMTRVSDTPPFAEAVADGGGLPFLALALMRGPEVRDLLARGRRSGSRAGPGAWASSASSRPSCGASRSRRSCEARPPFALIAGAGPTRRGSSKREGIATYLHVPSPGLLDAVPQRRRAAVRARRPRVRRARRAAVELRPLGAGGRGRRSRRSSGGVDPAEEIHLLFAGGIHDARSAAVVAGAGGAAGRARGARSASWSAPRTCSPREAVATGAIVAGFQERGASAAPTTVLLETGPGHEVRVSPTPFAERFERRAAAAARRGADRRRRSATTLEGLNVGRLRVAAKGVDRGNGRGLAAGGGRTGRPAASQRPLHARPGGHAPRPGHDDRRAAPRDRRRGRDLARTRIDAASEPCVETPAAAQPTSRSSACRRSSRARPTSGRSGRTRSAGHDAITEVPADRWDWRLYYDADPKAPDKITSKWGGFVPEVPFDPLRYGMPPTSLPSIEPLHLLTLEAVRAALDDAGYRDRPFPRERTAVVLGAGGGAAQLAMGYAFRSYLPLLDTVIPGAGREALGAVRRALARVDRGLVPGHPAERRGRAGSRTGSTWAGRTTRSTPPAARRWRRRRWRSASWRRARPTW